MAESGFRGKSMKAVAFDVAEGMLTVNPIFLKKFDKDMVKELHEYLTRTMTAVRNEQVAFHDAVALRKRNLRLQRLNNALIILKNVAREKKIVL